MRSAAGVRRCRCRRPDFSTSSSSGVQRGLGPRSAAGPGCGAGGASRMLARRRHPHAPDRGLGGAAPPFSTEPHPHPHPPALRRSGLGFPGPWPPPPLRRDVLNHFSAFPALCSPPPSAVAVRGARAGRWREWLRCRRGGGFSRRGAANSADPFFVVGSGMWGGWREVGRGAFWTRLEGVEDVVSRTQPGDCARRRLWLRSKPGGGESGFLSASLS